MEAKLINKKTIQLTENGQQLGELIYESLFQLKATIKLQNSDLYEIKPVGTFGTSITVTKNGMEVANLKMNWRGQIVFSFQDGREFILKAKGLLQEKYILENSNEEKLVQFDPKFDWRKFDYNYSITYEEPQGALLFLLGVYTCNYFIACMSGGFAGIA